MQLVSDGSEDGDSSSPGWLGGGIYSLQIVAGIDLTFVPGGQGFGASLIIDASIGMVGNTFGSQIGGGIGSMANCIYVAKSL